MPDQEQPPTHSVSEKGHAKNLENIKKKRDFAASWGANYQPTNPILQLDFVNNRIAEAEAVNDDLQQARAPYRVASSAAEDAFAPLSKRMTRLERGFKASGVPASAVDDLKTYTRKVKGTSKKKAGAGAGENEIAEKGHSTSQMSRVNRAENLDSGIVLLIAYGFKPNEPDLTTVALTDYSTELKAKTEAVNQAYIPVSNKLNERDDIFYESADSLYLISRGIEDYAVSHFGYDSPEHNQIRDLEVKKFTRRKNRG